MEGNLKRLRGGGTGGRTTRQKKDDSVDGRVTSDGGSGRIPPADSLDLPTTLSDPAAAHAPPADPEQVPFHLKDNEEAMVSKDKEQKSNPYRKEPFVPEVKKKQPRKERPPCLVGMFYKGQSSPSPASSENTTNTASPSASQQSTPQQSAPSSSNSMSYIDCADTAESSTCLGDDASVRVRFVSFLNEFTVSGQKKPFYPSFLNFMKERGTSTITISFEHVLKHDKELAIELCKRSRVWQASVQDFMMEHNFADEATILREAKVEFQKMPKSIIPLADLLKDKKLVNIVRNVFKNRRINIPTLSDLTIALISGYMVDIRNTHDKSMSWGGDYTVNDMLVVNYCEYRITKKPVDHACLSSAQTKAGREAFAEAKAKDLHTLEKIFTPRLSEINIQEQEMNDEPGFPLFYPSLRDALKTVDYATVKKDEFWDFILHHPALKSSTARSHLIGLLYLQFLKKRENDTCTRHLLETQALPGSDWQIVCFQSAVRVLRAVYEHRYEDGKRTSEENKDVGDEKFDDSNFGLLKYTRRFLQHATKYVVVQDITEVELFVSWKFSPFLPIILHDLLKDGLLQKGKLRNAWKQYSSFRVMTINGSSNYHYLELEFW